MLPEQETNIGTLNNSTLFGRTEEFAGVCSSDMRCRILFA